jgi:Tol biopolymer transport system component
MRPLLRSLAAIAVTMPLAAQQPAPRNGLPAVSSDGRHIAYVATEDGHDRVFVIDTDGTNARAVSSLDTDGRMPRWSGAGEILFAGAGADSGKVFVVAPGGTPRAVANVRGRSPVLSPDGTHVLYLVGPWTSTAIAVADVDGSHARIVAGGRTTAWNGAWSPDGKRIAYAYGDSSHVLQVHVVDADGTNDRAVTHATRDEGSAQMPAWSPDGRSPCR